MGLVARRAKLSMRVFLKAIFQGWDTELAGQPLWSTIMINHYDQPSWSTIVINHRDQPLWSTVVINRCDQPSWSTIVINHRDRPSWSTIVINHRDQPSWSTIVINHCEEHASRGHRQAHRQDYRNEAFYDRSAVTLFGQPLVRIVCQLRICPNTVWFHNHCIIRWHS